MKKLISIAIIIILAVIKLHAQCSITGTLSVCVGSTTQLTGSGTPGASSPWVSATPSVATVSRTGLVTAVSAGTSVITYTNNNGCSRTATITVNALPAAPTTGAPTQPTCTVATGSVVLNGLPATDTWTLTRNHPAGTTTTGSGTSTTISGLAANTYTFTVTNASGCTSVELANVVINAQPSTPTPPTVGTITQPTCTVATGSVVLNGLPATDTWTLTRNHPAGTTITGSGTSTTISGLAANTYTFKVTNASGCTSVELANVVINAQPSTPTPPTVGTITQPTCTVATGSVVLSGLPATGTWTLTRTPGNVITTGTGTSSTISGLPAGTYTFTVAFEAGCTSAASGNVVINAQPLTPTAPVVGTITQSTCTVATGSVELNGLPATGTWTITRTPDAVIIAGTGISTTISGLAAGTYTFTATNSSGCISPASGNVVINPQPLTPTAPTLGTLTQPTCSIATGSVELNGLPATGTWTITRTPGGTTNAGTGISTTISGIVAGTFTFTVTNASGCTSPVSGNVAINVQPVTPTAPTIGTITQPTLSVPTGSVVLNGLPATGTWILTRTPDNTITSGTGTSTTISGLPAGTYTFTATNASGCTSAASASVGLYTLTLFDPSDKILHPNDTIKINSSNAGSILISVESDADWTVSDNSMWFQAIKESKNSTIKVTFMENLSAIDKVAPLEIKYASNADVTINIQQKARVSQLNVSKFENIIIYPNPANDYVYLYFGDDYSGKIRISIATIQGLLLKTRELIDIQANQIIELDVAELRVGQYLIQLSDGKYQKIFQLIKY